MIPAGKELGAKGVALIAGVKLGIYRSYEEAVEKACVFKQTNVQKNTICYMNFSDRYGFTINRSGTTDTR